MAAPDFVPIDPTERVRTYSSPRGRAGAWSADRPGEVRGGQPRGDLLGSIGPDQGYAYRLVRHVEDHVQLGAVHREDAVAGCVAVAMKRAAVFGRAPVVHDITAAFTIFGFLDDDPPAELIELRGGLFAEVHNPHHYKELRQLADLVSEETLRQSPEVIAAQYLADWRANLGPGHAAH